MKLISKKLAEVCAENGDYLGTHESGAKYVYSRNPSWEYFRLPDYVVSSVCGGPTLWLVPRPSADDKGAE